MSQPTDTLLTLIATALAPMFLPAAGGDLSRAHAAAIETINACRPRTPADLIAAAQVVGFGLGAILSLSLAAASHTPAPLALRLRGNANACTRSAEQNRRALRDSHDRAEPVAKAAPAKFEPNPIPNVRQRAIEIRATTPTPVAPRPRPEAAAADRQWQTIWANAMAGVAAEYTADLATLPSNQRHAATLRAAALSSCASNLLSAQPHPA